MNKSLEKANAAVKILLMLTLVTNSVLANIFTWTDDNGQQHFSDTPRKNAKQYQLNGNTENNISIKIPLKNQGNSLLPISYVFNIVSPLNEATVRNNNGNLDIQASIDPQPPKNTLFQLVVDDNKIAKPQPSLFFTLTAMNRGKHKLAVEATLPTGEVLIQTPAISIFMHRAMYKPKAQPK